MCAHKSPAIELALLLELFRREDGANVATGLCNVLRAVTWRLEINFSNAAEMAARDLAPESKLALRRLRKPCCSLDRHLKKMKKIEIISILSYWPAETL